MKQHQLTAEAEWDAERYVLGDPSLDRDAFEDRMLQDEELALAVADGVRRTQLLAVASRSLPSLKSSTAGWVVAARYVRLAGAVLAASLLVAFAWWEGGLQNVGLQKSGLEHDGLQYGSLGSDSHEGASGDSAVSSNDEMLSEVAQHWLTFDTGNANLSDEFSYTLPVRDWSEPSEQSMGIEPSDSDWILQTAAEFFREADI